SPCFLGVSCVQWPCRRCLPIPKWPRNSPCPLAPRISSYPHACCKPQLPLLWRLTFPRCDVLPLLQYAPGHHLLPILFWSGIPWLQILPPLRPCPGNGDRGRRHTPGLSTLPNSSG